MPNISKIFLNLGSVKYIDSNKRKISALGLKSCAIVNTHGIVRKKISEIFLFLMKYLLTVKKIVNKTIAVLMILINGQYS
jgi:hypothetical protein